MKYLQKTKEYEDLKVAKEINKPVKLNKRSRSSYRIYRSIRNNDRLNKYNKAYPAGSKFRRQINKLKESTKTVMNTALNNTKDEPLKNIMNVSKNAQKFE